jgi:hypothetical protein
LKKLNDKYPKYTTVYMETSAKKDDGVAAAFQKIAELSFDK